MRPGGHITMNARPITLSDSNTFEYMTSHVMRGLVKLELDIEKD